MLKYRNHFNGWTTNKAPVPQDRKIKFHEETLRNLLAPQRKSKQKRYYDVYSDYRAESGDEFSENSSESSDGDTDKKK